MGAKWKYENIPGKDGHGNAMHLHRIAEAVTNRFVVAMEETHPEDSAKATRIVQCVNAYDELLAALERLVSYGDVFAYHKNETNPYKQAKAAIAAARGEV